VQNWTGKLNVECWKPEVNPAGIFHRAGSLMNYQAFTNDSLTMMYQGARGALAVDDALSELGKECRFRVRETPEWKIFVADLEAEMLKRGMVFEVIDWSDDLFSAVHSAIE
jgi:hypothetical protein